MKKINFSLNISEDGYPPVDVESVWATHISDKLYEMDSIPFFTYDATVGDLVSAMGDENGNLWFQKTEQRSSHSLIRVVFFDRDCVEEVIEKLRAIGCSTERMLQYNLVAVDIPSSALLEPVQVFLKKENLEGRVDYEEALLRY